ncbi:glycosyltransferase family 4 protein [Isoptericola chiayiensis]|uniref:D-inositol 3-phosphate glycosyltransferase n=1 Tax=Isoptericola chiayiensis TaxID=579446 RepID=A0ABP8Y5N6_9MICO|nr:glycosyltransferase [Isoptericola chiayiensis]NOV99453.1 glycosyltransferase involved in cell wall biosynthesis [Isoptericola chiayiensis]
MSDGVVLAHDYATQRGGAERVALLMAQAFPGSPLYTTLYEPSATFPEFGALDLRVSALNRYRMLRRHHRLAFPVLSRAVDHQRVVGDVLVASSTGWAHGYRGAQRSVVYCHAPARWLYQRDRYLGAGGGPADRLRRALAGAVLGLTADRLRSWDQRAARRADLYLVNSSVTRDAVRVAYGIEAEVLPPPGALSPTGPCRAVEAPGGHALEPGFLLCVARLLPYKNVDVVIEAAAELGRRLVVVGEGPDRSRLEQRASRLAPGAVTFAGRVDDSELRWLYSSASVLVASSYEDYGLTPLEAGEFGLPVAALRGGGYLDTVAEHVNGAFFDHPTSGSVAAVVQQMLSATWDDGAIAAHLEQFSADRFAARLRQAAMSESMKIGAQGATKATSAGAQP